MHAGSQGPQIKANNFESGSKIFQWLGPDGEQVRLDSGRHLDAFAEAVGTPPHQPRNQPSSKWHWHPHQFRRLFAILYFYRFEGATIEALSHHLRHFDLNTTRAYTSRDPQVAAFWVDTEWHYTRHVAQSIVDGERLVSGAAGERLKKLATRLVDRLGRKLQVIDPERVGASLALIMQRRGMVLTPKPWVTCSCPRTFEGARTAACRRRAMLRPGTVGPDFAEAGPTVCGDCTHAIIEGPRSAFVTDQLKHFETAAASGCRSGTLFGALEEARVLELREVYDNRYKNAQSFPPIKHSPGNEVSHV